MTTNRKETSPVNPTRTAIGAASLAVLLTLTACGGDEADGGNGNASGTATDTPTDSASTRPPGGVDADQLQEIQQCLEAAGLEDALPTDMPTDMPTDLPTDMPTGGPGGGLAALQDPEVQAALEACGIEVAQPPGNDAG